VEEADDNAQDHHRVVYFLYSNDGDTDRVFFTGLWTVRNVGGECRGWVGLIPASNLAWIGSNNFLSQINLSI
jgi:hypothetical protein